MPGRPLPACRRRRPRWVRISARPLASRPPWPSGCTKPWAPRMSVISWLPLLRPTRLRASASTTPLPRPPPGSLPVWVGSPLTGRVSHPLDDKQSFMMSSHHHSPLTSLAWSHHATTPVSGNARCDASRRPPTCNGSRRYTELCRISFELGDIYYGRGTTVCSEGRRSSNGMRRRVRAERARTNDLEAEQRTVHTNLTVSIIPLPAEVARSHWWVPPGGGG